MRSTLIILGISALLVGLYFGAHQWLPDTPERKVKGPEASAIERQALTQVSLLLEQKDTTKAKQALDIIAKHNESMLAPGETGRQWRDLFIDACVQTNRVGPAIALFDFSPEAFSKNERGALTVGEALIDLNRTIDFARLRDRWRGKEKEKGEWLLLDAAYLGAQGRISEAADLLHSTVFNGPLETRRRIQLGSLYTTSDPEKAWRYLTEAARYDKDNPEVRILRGRLLEVYGKTDLARSEYLAAAAQEPKNIQVRDALGEFYRRQGNYTRALATWAQALKLEPNDEIWAKARFWSMMIQNVECDWNQAEAVQEGPLKPLLTYMVQLEKGTFWDEELAAKSEGLTQLRGSHQATFWLQLLQHLKSGREQEASRLLETNPFASKSWEPDLELALRRILHFRETGDLTYSDPHPIPRQRHIFFKNMDELISEHPSGKVTAEELPESMVTLLQGDEAFAAAFLAAGWREAALQLSRQTILPKNSPDWLTYRMTQTLQANRGCLAALEYAARQTPSQPLDLLQAEILIADGQIDAGTSILRQYADRDTKVGLRAAWLLSNVHIHQHNFSAAETIIRGNLALQESLPGRESLARIAFLKGDRPLADRLYTQLETESSEARSYLARRAYEVGQYHRARELTEQLLQEHPTDITIRKNLKAILDRVQHEQ